MANGDEILPSDDQLVNAPQEAGLPLESQLRVGIQPDTDLPAISDLEVGLPPNEPGVESLVDAATIGQFSPGGQPVPGSDVAFIQQQLDPLGGQPIALGDVTQEMFTPGINLPLAVGGTSGQLTGSRNIFVAQNQAVPFALLERRRAAQQQAALKRQKDLERFKLRKPALSKDPRFNQQLVDTFNDFTDIFVDRATQQFGSREAAMMALTSPTTKIGREYAQQMDNLEILAGEVDQVVDLNAEVEKAREEGDQFVSDETLRLHEEFKDLSGRFAGGDAFGAASLRDNLTALQTSQSLDQFMKENDTLKSIEGEILQTAGVDASRADHFRTSTRFRKNFEEGARAQAKAIKNNVAFRNRQDLTEDDIYKRIIALKGKVDKRTTKVTKKHKTDGFTDKSQVPVSNQPKAINIGENQFMTKVSVPYSASVQKNPLKVDGMIVVDERGNPQIKQGITNFIPVENSVISTPGGDRRVVRGKERINVADLSKEERRAMGIPRDSKQKFVDRDITVDYDNIEGSLKGSSQSAKASVEAFGDVSQASKRQKQFIDVDNVKTDFTEAYIRSGFTDPDEFIEAAGKQGIDVVLNPAARAEIDKLKDPLDQ